MAADFGPGFELLEHPANPMEQIKIITTCFVNFRAFIFELVNSDKYDFSQILVINAILKITHMRYF